MNGGEWTGPWETQALQLWGLTVGCSVNHVIRVVSPVMFRSPGVFSTPPFCPHLVHFPSLPCPCRSVSPLFTPASSSCVGSMQHSSINVWSFPGKHFLCLDSQQFLCVSFKYGSLRIGAEAPDSPGLHLILLVDAWNCCSWNHWITNCTSMDPMVSFKSHTDV